MGKSRYSRLTRNFACIIIALLCLCILPAMAQDATLEATVDATPFTVIDGQGEGDTIVNVGGETPAAPVDPAEPWYAKYLAQLTALVIAAGTLLYGGLKAANKWLEGKKTDVGAMSGAEWAYSRSPSWLKTMIVSLIKEFVRFGGNLDEIRAELEDETAFAVKQALPKPASRVTPGGYTETQTPPMP